MSRRRQTGYSDTVMTVLSIHHSYLKSSHGHFLSHLPHFMLPTLPVMSLPLALTPLYASHSACYVTSSRTYPTLCSPLCLLCHFLSHLPHFMLPTLPVMLRRTKLTKWYKINKGEDNIFVASFNLFWSLNHSSCTGWHLAPSCGSKYLLKVFKKRRPDDCLYQAETSRLKICTARLCIAGHCIIY